MRLRGAWAGFVALRYFHARKKNGGGASSILASLGIAVGTAALIVVIGVMNGFQSGFIDSILEVDSHHLRVTFPGDATANAEAGVLAARLRQEPGVSAAVIFADFETVALGRTGLALPLRIKALPEDASELDPRLLERLSLSEGAFINSAENGVVLGSELARQLDAYLGDEVSLLSVSASASEGVQAETLRLPLIGVFRSGYYNFDYGLGFVSFKTAAAFGGPYDLILGIKLKDRYADERFAARLENVYGIDPARVITWREYNKSFFGALRMEKTAMMLLVGLIFVVVAVNIFHSMRRTVFERMEDIAVLKALGGSALAVRRVFVLDGLVTGLLGSTFGLVAGLLIVVNINETFAAVEALINAAIRAWNSAAAGSGATGGFRVFSPAYFYLIRVPSKISFEETLFIFTAGVSSAVAAALAASRRVLRFRPAEVLRNE